MKEVTVKLPIDYAEKVLRDAAYKAAYFGSLLDYMTRRTKQRPGPGYTLDEGRIAWKEGYLSAKRVVQAFGVEYEPVSEQETLTVTYEYKGGKTKRVMIAGLLKFNHTEGGRLDYDNPIPCYRGEVHREACEHAAASVVKSWKGMIG